MFLIFLIFAVIILHRISELDKRLKILEKKMGGISKEEERPPQPGTSIDKLLDNKDLTPIDYNKKSAEYDESKSVVSEKSRKEWLRLEKIIGERWLVWVGVLLLSAGFAGFLKYAFEQGWIGEALRCFFGFLLGLIFIGISQHLRKKNFLTLAQGIFGLSLIIFYITIFTAYHFYKLFNIQLSFILFFLVTLGGMFVSVTSNSLATSLLSTIGAFLTPLLLVNPGTEIYYEPKLFIYLLILNIGVLFAVSFRKWRALPFLSFLFTLYYFIDWYLVKQDLRMISVFAGIYFLTFAITSLIYSIIKKEKSNWEDLLLVVANPLVFFLVFRDMFSMPSLQNIKYILPYIPVLMAASYFILAYLIRKTNNKDKLLYFGFIGTSIGLLTLPVPMMVKNLWITFVWGVEAIILMMIGSKIDRKSLRVGGLIIFILVTARLFFIDTFFLYSRGKTGLLFLNTSFLTILLSSLTFLFSAVLLGRGKNFSYEEKNYTKHLWSLFILGLFWISNIEIFSYFSGATGMLDGVEWLVSTIFWAIFALFLIFAEVKKETSLLRSAGLVLLTLTFLKVLVDTLVISPSFYSPQFLFNFQFLSVGTVLVAMLLGAKQFDRKDISTLSYEKNSDIYLWTLFILLLFIEMNIQVYSSCNIVWNVGEDKLVAAISLLWILYGFGLLVVGLVKKILSLRISALSLFGLTLLKIISVDIKYIGSFAKMLILIGTGIILITGAYFYRRFRQKG